MKRTWLGRSLLGAVCILATTALAHGDSPQLVVQRAEADLTAETLLVEGQNLLLRQDSEVSLTLAGTPLDILSATDVQVLAQLPPGLAPGTYLLKVSRGSGSVRNDVFDVTVGAVGPEGPLGPMGPEGPRGPEGRRGEPGLQGAPGLNGVNGAPGPTGANGPSGAVGATGGQGLQGPAGPTGPAGANGAGGPTGPTGPQGPQGQPGGSSLPPAFRSPEGEATLVQTLVQSTPWTQVVTKLLPAGSYVLTYDFTILNENDYFAQNNSRTVICGKTPSSQNDGISGLVPGSFGRLEHTFTTTAAFSVPTSVGLECKVNENALPPGVSSQVRAFVRIIAIRVDSIS